MSRLLSLRNASRIKPRHSHLNTSTCQHNVSARLVANGKNTTHHANRFNSSNSNANAKMNAFSGDREKHLIAAQLPLNLSKRMQMQAQTHSQAEGKGAPLLNELTAWVLQKVKVPKGELVAI